MAIINFSGVQLDVTDNGDGTFDVRPLDAVVDKQVIRDEIARLKLDRETERNKRDEAVERRDALTAARTQAIADRTAAVDAIQALSDRILELRDFIVSAGDPDPGV